MESNNANDHPSGRCRPLDLRKPDGRLQEKQIRNKISRWLGSAQFLEALIRYLLLYPPQGDKGPYRTATIQSKLNLTQNLLADALGLDSLISVKNEWVRQSAPANSLRNHLLRILCIIRRAQKISPASTPALERASDKTLALIRHVGYFRVRRHSRTIATNIHKYRRFMRGCSKERLPVTLA